jgi:radical SAM superfamily enzyme YgiQ (UPF0313 family)
MLKDKLQSIVKPKVFWSSITILVVLCVCLYVLEEKEKSSRIYTEKELSRTIEVKKVVENNLVEAKKQIASRDEQIKLTLDKLEKEITARKDTEAKLLAVIKEKKVLEEKITEIAARSPNIELEKIVIKTGSELTGKVSALDKEHNFVVIDLGSESNLELGDILSVYRNEQFIAKVQIEKIEEKTSATIILPEWQNAEIKENDVVKRI